MPQEGQTQAPHPIEREEVSLRAPQVKYEDFLTRLEQLRRTPIDTDAFVDALTARLTKSQSNAYVLIKDEVRAVAGLKPTNPITSDAVRIYCEVNGGDAFRASLQHKGFEGLSHDFKNVPAKFIRDRDVLAEQRDELIDIVEGTSSGRSKGKKINRELSEQMSQKISLVAQKSGKNISELTFEDAFNQGLYGEALQPDLNGVAEYGLTWHEYEDRRERMKAVERSKQAILQKSTQQQHELAAEVATPSQGEAAAEKVDFTKTLVQELQETAGKVSDYTGAPYQVSPAHDKSNKYGVNTRWNIVDSQGHTGACLDLRTSRDGSRQWIELLNGVEAVVDRYDLSREPKNTPQNLLSRIAQLLEEHSGITGVQVERVQREEEKARREKAKIGKSLQDLTPEEREAHDKFVEYIFKD